MNRRDVIVVAVLANVCIVVVMMISAVRHTPREIVPTTLEVAKAPQVEEKVESGAIKQVEEVLTAYKTSPPAVTKEVKAKVAPPQPKLAVEPPVKNALKEIEVQSGDMLEKLARRHHISVDELMKINQLTSTRLKVGQVLYVPEGRGQTEIVKIKEEGKYYTVKNGDSPWKIAVKNHMRVDQLLELNGLDEKTAKKLKPGDRLKIQ